MNYHSDKYIMDGVREHYNEALEYFPEDSIVESSIKVVAIMDLTMKSQMLILNLL